MPGTDQHRNAAQPLQLNAMNHPDEDDLDPHDLLTREPYACAFCGEENDVLVDGSGARTQRFTEDCQVCCRPNLLSITIHRDNSVELWAEQEYEA